MGILKELKAEQDEEALRLGDKWVETDRLFVKWNGEPMNNQTPYGWLKEFCGKNDMPFYGLHSFRHFAASALISSGLDVVTVSGALGHCNSGTTILVPNSNTKTHAVPTDILIEYYHQSTFILIGQGAFSSAKSQKTLRSPID